MLFASLKKKTKHAWFRMERLIQAVLKLANVLLMIFTPTSLASAIIQTVGDQVLSTC